MLWALHWCHLASEGMPHLISSSWWAVSARIKSYYLFSSERTWQDVPLIKTLHWVEKRYGLYPLKTQQGTYQFIATIPFGEQVSLTLLVKLSPNIGHNRPNWNFQHWNLKLVNSLTRLGNQSVQHVPNFERHPENPFTSGILEDLREISPFWRYHGWYQT